MTTIGSSHGPTEVINARRTESIDAPAIQDLIAHCTITQFGRVNIVHLIEKSNLSVTLNNEENEVLGFAGFLDHPHVEVCDQDNWESWMNAMKYDLCNVSTPLNSLFLHYFVAKDDYTIGCASEIVRTVFNAVPDLRFILLTVRTDAELEPALAEIFSPVEKKSAGGSPFSLYVCHRHSHVPILHIRKAVVEDHDDLTPLFKRLNNNLTERYGSYFLAEMIEAQDDNNKAMVAEVGGKAIGFMSVCSHVNIELLQTSFELDPFHGLCKPHPDDLLEEEKPEKPEAEHAEAPPQQRTSLTSTTGSFTELSSEMSHHTVTEQIEQLLQESSKEDVSNAHGADTLVSDRAATPTASQTSAGSAPVAFVPKLSEAHMMRSSSVSLGLEEPSDSLADEEVFLCDAQPFYQETSRKFMPTYFGDSNVFSIQLFCINEQYEMRSTDFLPEIFKLFPDKDMVALTTPHMVPEFPLIQQFVRVTPRPTSNVPHELYVFHRHGLMSSKFKVRPACTVDYPKVEKLVKNIDKRDVLLKDLQLFNSARRDDDGTTIQAFVADCLDQVVGICIIRREEEVEYIRSHYNVEDFVYFNHHRRDEHAHLHHFALNPIFQHYAKHFMKEVLRQGKKSCIYYPVYPDNAAQSVLKQHSLITGLNFMVPVRARQQIEYPMKELGVNAPSQRVIGHAEPYALNHINRKLTLEPKVTINARVVVVGASDVGIAFLENICFCPHLRFNNLTLISKRGLPCTLRSNANAYTPEELARLSLRSWVNIVEGSMTAIDRPRKQVVMEDGTRVTYDHVILCTGQQFQIPALSGADVDEDATNHDLPKGVTIRPYDINLPVPENVLALNDDADHKVFLLWASKMSGKLQESGENLPYIVVYGRPINAFAAIEDLLSCGIPGSRLVLVRPPAEYSSLSVCNDGCNGDPFNEPAVTDAVAAALAEANVRVLEDHALAQWEIEETLTGGKITSLSFTTPRKPLVDLPCIGLISLHPRRIDHRAFLACNDSCLVFDGRLAIDANFKTNDPYVRAAGPLTKYTRRYYADSFDYRHENYSSREIGFRLAMNILPLFDPTLDGDDELSGAATTPAPSVKPDTPAAIMAENPHDKLLPVYIEPKITFSSVPGGFHYLHIRRPGERPTFAVQLSESAHGREFITGSPAKGNYFRLHINQYRRVETITCLVKPEVVELPFKNIVRLYGMHQRYLNNLEDRFEEGLISDLFAYFREPWVMAVFHDRFRDFRQEIRDLLCSALPGASNVPSVDAYVRQLAEDDLTLSSQQKGAVKHHYNATGQRRAIETRLLSYISYNYYHLPMYAKPGMV